MAMSKMCVSYSVSVCGRETSLGCGEWRVRDEDTFLDDFNVVSAWLINCRRVFVVASTVYCERCCVSLGIVDKYGIAHLNNVRQQHYDSNGLRITSARRELFPALPVANESSNQRDCDSDSSEDRDHLPKSKRTRLEDEVMLVCVQLSENGSSVVYNAESGGCNDNARSNAPTNTLSRMESRAEFLNQIGLNLLTRPYVMLDRSVSTISASKCSCDYDSLNENETIEIFDSFSCSDDSSTLSDWSEDVFPLTDYETPVVCETRESMCTLSISSTDSYTADNMQSHPNFQAIGGFVRDFCGCENEFIELTSPVQPLDDATMPLPIGFPRQAVLHSPMQVEFSIEDLPIIIVDSPTSDGATNTHHHNENLGEKIL